LANSEGCSEKPPTLIQRVRALDLGAGHQRENQQQDRCQQAQAGEAAHPAWRRQRHGDQQRRGEGQQHDLAARELEGLQADTLGGGRRGGQHQHGAEAHEGDQRDQCPAVDGPPPAAQQACVGAREAAHAAPSGRSAAP
jgi:hypothetical protein